MSPLALTLFGSFTAVTAGQTLRLPTDKTRALLAYLALTADTPLRREGLAGLLWPDQTEVMARQNLRKTAGRLKQTLEEADPALAARLLSVTKQTIELSAAECAVDVLVFRDHLATAHKHAHASLGQCAACLARLETAVGLYRQGELLAGLSLPDAAPFEEWLLMQRENLAQQQLAALDRLTSAYEQQGAFEKARQFALWQIQQEPWREAAHRQLMRLLAAQGLRAEAIAQYQACRRTLQTELAVEPAAETEALLTQIMEGALPVAAAPSVAAGPPPWPRLTGLLIGREAEFARLVGLLAEPACRVLTVTGLGGIGKTSLALAVGEHLRHTRRPGLPEGIYFVPLAEITSAGLLPAAIAEAVGLALNQRQSIAAQVEQFLRPTALVLILDNFVPAAMNVEWVHRLVATAPQLKLLITAREPLNWQEEWRYPLEGLRYPAEGGEAGAFEAVQLFVQAARQIQPHFAITPDNRAAIARICRLVHGWPLALQMAAAWVRMMSCEAIADQISGSLDILTTSLRDVPPRQRSIRVIFEHTWDSLGEAEQRLLAQLAVFRGGFTLAAAVAVTAAAPLTLRDLVDKTLVQHDALTDRYHLHEVLRQFALDKAAAEPAAQAQAAAAHGRYFLGLLHSQGERLATKEYQAALTIIKADIDNLRQAWLWAATTQARDLLADNLGAVAQFYDSSGLPQEGATFFQRTIAVLAAAGPDQPDSLLAPVHVHLAESLLTMGQYAEATAAVSAGQALAQTLGDHALRSRLFVLQAVIYREQGRYEQTHAVLSEAIAYSAAHQEVFGLARALHIQGNTYWSMGDYDQARRCYEDARQYYQQSGDKTMPTMMTGNIGVVLWRLGDYRGALANYQVALEAARQVGSASRVALWLGNAGLVYVDLQEDEQAFAYLDEALKLHAELGRNYYAIEPLLGKVALYLRRGDMELAAPLLQQATDLSYRIGNRAYLLDCDRWQARLYVAQGRPAEAISLLQSMQVREFRPDAAATLARELEQLLAAASLPPV